MAATPLSGNEKALVISVLVVGGLAALFTALPLGTATYTLTTGKVFGSEVSRAAMRGVPSRDAKGAEFMERALELQREAQVKWAPAQVGSEGAYLLALVAMGVFALRALSKGEGRRELGLAALAASAVRIGNGVVTWLFTSDVMRATVAVMEPMMQDVTKGDRSAEKAHQVMKLTQGALGGISAVSGGCITLLMCGFYAAVAYVFLVRKPAASPPGPQGLVR